MKKDPFAALGLTRKEIDVLPDATAQKKAIKAAYRTRAIKYHPDSNSGDKDTIRKFKEVTAAHDALLAKENLDPSQRHEWDISWSAGESQASSPEKKTWHWKASDDEPFWQAWKEAERSPPSWQQDRGNSSGKQRSVDARNKYGQICDKTLDELNQYYWQHARNTDFSDYSLLWAFRRAQEILGDEINTMPPLLFQFNRYDSEYCTNLGIDRILYDKEKFGKKIPGARSDTFVCDTFFISHFLAALAPVHKPFSEIFNRDKLGYIVGNLGGNENIGFVIEDFSSSCHDHIKKHFLTIVTPDIAHTREAFESMIKAGLIGRKQTQEMLEYGYNYRVVRPSIKNGEIDPPLLKMLEEMLGVEQRPAIIEEHHSSAGSHLSDDTCRGGFLG